MKFETPNPPLKLSPSQDLSTEHRLFVEDGKLCLTNGETTWQVDDILKPIAGKLVPFPGSRVKLERLVTAAPDLLAALEGAVELIEALMIRDRFLIETDHIRLNQARKAIAKAKGETP